MSYVIYNKVTTKILYAGRGKNDKKTYKTEGAARAALTRYFQSPVDDWINRNKPVEVREDYNIAEYIHFCEKIEKTVTVKNLMSGRDVVQSVNTPLSCDVSRETYWSI